MDPAEASVARLVYCWKERYLPKVADESLALVKFAHDCMHALGFPFDLYVVTKNKGDGIVITNSFHEKPKFFEISA